MKKTRAKGRMMGEVAAYARPIMKMSMVVPTSRP